MSRRFLLGLLAALVLPLALPADGAEKDLPRALIIGDSISIGYTKPVQQMLEGKADVQRIPANAGHTGMGLANLDKWLGEDPQSWDVIHFNWGLWDLCYRANGTKIGKKDKKNGKVSHTVEEYAQNLDKLVERLKKTGATLIFATTTPVPEGEPGRIPGDDDRYNEAALKVMKKHGIKINDLHAVMDGKMKEFAVGPGNVHFTPAGSKKLAEQVVSEIEKALQK